MTACHWMVAWGACSWASGARRGGSARAEPLGSRVDTGGGLYRLGMEKWSYAVRAKSGALTDVHFVRVPERGNLMDFKFKVHSDSALQSRYPVTATPDAPVPQPSAAPLPPAPSRR